MIFKHLFRSKHLSSDPQVRIQSIDNLNSQDAAGKSILHELAFNDPDPKVSLAALDKLDSFVLWYKMSEIAKNDRVRKKSIQIVESTLLTENDVRLDKAEKRKFILEARDNRLLEKLLLQLWIQQDTDLSMSLLAKIDRPQLKDRLLLDTKNESLQLAILATFDDTSGQRKLLNKLLKKSDSVAVKQKADELLAEWLKVEKISQEVEQQVTMLLSRLLTLKDSQDLLLIEKQQTELTEQYQQLSSNFVYLSEIKKQEIEQKFADISQRVERNIALLKPQWLALQAEQKLQHSVDNITLKIKQILQDLSSQLATRLKDINADEVDDFKQKLSQQSEELHKLISQIPASDKAKHTYLEQLNNQIDVSQSTLLNLPEFQAMILSANELVEQFAGLSLPDDASQVDAAQEYLNELLQQWRDLVGPNRGLLPKELDERWHTQVKSWKRAISELRKQITAELNRCRNKLKAVESLVRQGKFKAAMGLYQKVQVWFDNLPEKSQAQLQRIYSDIKEQIENLKDWQDYISAPRKPALLKEIEALVLQPLDIDAQSKAIKALRYQWNSLGKTDTESDQALNQAFEAEIEKAFAPCREHYDQQQQLREANLHAKQQVLEDIHIIANKELPVAELAKELRQLQQKWRSVGEVDYKLRNDIYQKYQQAIIPLKEKVSAFYNDNAQQKQQLLDKAQALLNLESIADAIEQAKKLQEKWKTIEHAGKKAEAELWSAFRKSNDSLFAKRAELNQQHKAEITQHIEQVSQQVDELETALTTAQDKLAVRSALQNASQVQTSLGELPNSVSKALEQKINNLFDKQKQKLTTLTQVEKEQEYIELFNVLRGWEQGQNTPEVAQLKKQWQAGFANIAASADRDDITLKMEIVADKPSPDSEKTKRQQVQMELMAQKLQSGDNLDLKSLLIEWISGGALTVKDKVLLKRIEVLFIPESVLEPA